MTKFLPQLAGRILAMTLFLAIAALFVPAPAKGMAMTKPSCCTQMQTASEKSDDSCPMHKKQSPAREQESPCCQACALGLALLFVPPPAFVYASTGEASLVSLSISGHSLPHRPPVPPPRFTLA